MIALADCNNFFCSCERVFHPGLRNKPVVVLSNNDGCIIARSNEVKAMGIKMGTPLFKVRDFLEKNGVAVFSSNFNLYGDMSRRVMSILAGFTPGLHQYSIDEAFLDLKGMDDGTPDFLKTYGTKIVRTVGRGTGIPITVGIAPTKTLAKVASRYGKRFPAYHGVCVIDTEDKRVKALKGLDIADVWGIGRRHLEMLRYNSVRTAWNFTQKSEGWIRSRMNVTGIRTWKELKGEDCIQTDGLTQKKSICTSRSFAGEGLSDLHLMEEAVADFTASCCRKLKQQHSCCRALTVFACTSRFRQDVPQSTLDRTCCLTVPTNDTQELVNATLRLLKADFQEGCLYKRAGVIVSDITSDTAVQTILFDPIDRRKQARLAKAIDTINRKNGHDTVKLAIQGTEEKKWIKSEHRSRQYTTSLRDIIRVKTG